LNVEARTEDSLQTRGRKKGNERVTKKGAKGKMKGGRGNK